MSFFIKGLIVFIIIHFGAYFLFFKQIFKSRIPLLIAKIFLIVNFCGIFGYFAARRIDEFPHSLYFLVSLSIGVGFVLLVVTFVYQVLSLVLKLLLWLSPQFLGKRRGFLQKSLNLASGIFALGYFSEGVIEGSLEPKIERVKIPLDNLKAPIRAVQISDLHIGGIIEENAVARIVAAINELKPDFITLTGDIVDTKIEKVPKALQELSKLQAPLGVYFIVGNHEYFHNISELLSCIKSMGFKVLENECVVLKKRDLSGSEAVINLAGVYDLFGRRIGALEPNLEQALQNRVESQPTILLAHQPKFSKEVKEAHKVDLILSGHTHGGQIFPFTLLVKLDQPYLAGLYQHSTKTQIYVNRGTGFWGPPMRCLTRAEITFFEFVVG